MMDLLDLLVFTSLMVRLAIRELAGSLERQVPSIDSEGIPRRRLIIRAFVSRSLGRCHGHGDVESLCLPTSQSKREPGVAIRDQTTEFAMAKPHFKMKKCGLDREETFE
jgi:hypothetical protein